MHNPGREEMKRLLASSNSFYVDPAYSPYDGKETANLLFFLYSAPNNLL